MPPHQRTRHKKTAGTAQTARLVLLIAALTLLLAIALMQANMRDPLGIFVLKLWLQSLAAQLFQHRAELLFFLGTTYLSILLLKQKRWVWAKLAFVSGLLWLMFHDPLFGLIRSLGVDSFSEAKDFDLEEARFWISTLGGVLQPNLNIKIFLIYFLLAISSYFIIKWLLHSTAFTQKHYSFIKFSLSALLIGGAIQITFFDSIATFLKNSESYSVVRRNFDHASPPVQSHGSPMNLFLFVGESTSVMNMGIYGYPRPTTPLLQKLSENEKNLIIYQNVFSTHTHTSPSLLEAFSLPINSNERFLPIARQQRLSVVGVLRRAGIEVNLFSNQGEAGTWNQASSIIFREARRTFSTKSSLVGNLDHTIKKPWDDEFFADSLNSVDWDKYDDSPTVTFLHAYSGHGPYLANIPESFRVPVDEYYKGKTVQHIFGKGFPASATFNVEAYDATLKYIDFSVHKTIQKVKELKKPAALIYFADHGDSVFTNRGHDSSRFIHEMARVPFVIYFNDAAVKAYPKKFEQYVRLAKSEATSTLAQLPAVILDLVGVQMQTGDHIAKNIPSLIGEKTSHPPIIVRQLSSGISYVNLNNAPFEHNGIPNITLHDKTDSATQIFAANHGGDTMDPYLCYHRSNTLAKTLRGRLVSSCIEADIVVEADSTVAVYHPPAANTGFKLGEMMNLRGGLSRTPVWLDSKNLHDESNCSALLDQLKNSVSADDHILVEFPSQSYTARPKIRSCVSALKSLGVRVSYYVPTDIAARCALALTQSHEFASQEDCLALQNDLKKASESGLFSDISFDYGGLPAIKSMSFLEKFHWNTWAVSAEKLRSVDFKRFKFVILNTADPNNI